MTQTEKIILKYVNLIKKAKLEYPTNWEAVVAAFENELDKDLANLRQQAAEDFMLLYEALENEKDQEPVEPDLR
jgi:hypothetical protein